MTISRTEVFTLKPDGNTSTLDELRHFIEQVSHLPGTATLKLYSIGARTSLVVSLEVQDIETQEAVKATKQWVTNDAI